MKKIWRDVQIFKIVMLTIIALCIILFFFGYVLRDSNSGPKSLPLIIIFSILFIYCLITLLMPKNSYITEGGVRVGNISSDVFDYNIFTFRSKSLFLEWSEIKTVKVVNKEVKHNFYVFIKSFLIVSSNKGTYETFIADPKGFVNTLIKLGKGRLIAKDSKYLPK